MRYGRKMRGRVQDGRRELRQSAICEPALAAFPWRFVTFRRLARLLAFCPWLSAAVVPAGAQTVVSDPLVVTASRAEWPAGTSAFSTRVMGGDELREAPGLTLDEALRSVPSFSLFRRTDSLAAHPTAQGVSLRGLGPSGASRSLVLLDGVPLNDPFGGWVTWAKLPREGLARVEVVSGGGASAWGNAALGGVLQVLTADAPTVRSGALTALAGDFSTRSFEGYASEPVAGGLLQFSGRLFATHGYHLVAPEDAGAIDTPAWTRHQTAAVRWSGGVGEGLTATVGARWFHERRGNGTPYTTNATDDGMVSAGIEGRTGASLHWAALVYGETEGFSSTFSSVNADRSAETPASDQYDVPARAGGISLTGEWRHDGGARTAAGADARWVRGESREHYSYANGGFTRARAAGGRQLTTGVFAVHERPLGGGVVANVGSRVDFWREAEGFRNESDLVSAASLRADRYPAREGWEWSPGAGLTGRAGDHLRWRVSGQRAFRRPTLNELYRPFRVGNVITETNPALRTESATTAEAGLAADWGSLSTGLTAFWSELHDAVGNVTVARGPGNVPGFGFIPPGGLGRRRENLDRVRVRGLEWSANWRLGGGLALTAAALLNDAEVTRAPVAPGLVGKRVAQVPRTNASVGATWSRAGWTVGSRARWMGAQFEDDENALRLAPALVVDASVRRELGEHAEVFLSAENLFNERIETGRTSATLTTVGTPRFTTGGVRVRW